MREEYRELGLTGFSLAIYAIIASYSQKGKGCYYGGYSCLAEMAGCCRVTACRLVRRMTEDGLLESEDLVTKTGKVKAIRIVTKCYHPKQQNVTTPSNILSADSEADLILNNNNKIDNDISKDIRGKVFRKPTLSEVEDYIAVRGSDVDPEAFFAYYESNGWKVGGNPMKDWHAAVVTWEKRQKADKQRQHAKTETSFERSMRVLDEMYGTHFSDD